MFRQKLKIPTDDQSLIGAPLHALRNLVKHKFICEKYFSNQQKFNAAQRNRSNLKLNAVPDLGNK